MLLLFHLFTHFSFTQPTDTNFIDNVIKEIQNDQIMQQNTEITPNGGSLTDDINNLFNQYTTKQESDGMNDVTANASSSTYKEEDGEIRVEAELAQLGGDNQNVDLKDVESGINAGLNRILFQNGKIEEDSGSGELKRDESGKLVYSYCAKLKNGSDGDDFSNSSIGQEDSATEIGDEV